MHPRNKAVVIDFRSIWRVILFVSFSNFLAILANSQPLPNSLNPSRRLTQYTTDAWTVEDGLPSNTINDCLLGKDNYLWFATYDGLVRFDGVKFTKYDKANSPAFTTNGIWKIYEDAQGLWIGTNGGGLILRKGNKFFHYDPGSNIQGAVVTAIEGDGERGYWLGSRSGLVHFQDSTFSPIDHPILGTSNIYDLRRDQQGRLWIATSGDGVFYYDEGVFTQITEQNSLLPSNSTRALYTDSDGTVWIGTDEGFVCWRQGKIQYLISQQNGLPGNTVNCFLKDNIGTLWVGTDEGLVRFGEEERSIETLNQDLGLSHSTVESMVEDPEGSLWLGTYRGGINRVKDGKFSNFGKPEALPDDVINVTYPDGDQIWVGTDNGLALFKDNTIVQISLGSTPEENRVRDILRDTQNRLWICTHNGLVQYENGRVIQRISEAEGLANSSARNILEDTQGRLWIGTRTGLSRIELDGTIRTYNKDNGITNEFIMSLYESEDGGIWVGTNGGGIYVIKDGKISNITKADGLAADVIFRITADPDGFTWIGTTGGLSVLYEDKIKSIGIDQGLAGNSVFQLLLDQMDAYWLNTDRGVIRIEQTELQRVARNELDRISNSKLFNDADGMRSREITGASNMGISEEGKLWVPTQLGVTVIDPQNIPLNTLPPPVRIESIRINQEIKEENSTSIKIPRGKNRIEIQYTALTYFAPKNVQFRYRLDGYDDNWQEAGLGRVATYTNLPPGKYNFQVIAANNDGIWNTQGASIKMSKSARFVQTPYFYLLLLIGVGVFGFIGYYVRLTTLNSRNQLLSEMVEERTYNIQQQSEAIRQQAEELETINSIVQTINQELEMDRVLDALLTEAMKLFPQAERASFLTFNDQNHKYEFSATRGLNIEEFSQVRLTPQEAFGTFGDDYQELEEGVYIVKSFRDVIGKLTLKNVRSSLVMTIKLGAFPEGFLFLFNTTNLRAFDKSDSARLKRFRDHALSAYSKAKVLQELEVQKRELELYFQNMNDSVQYARRIQEALLPRKELRQTLFPESFIFYQPKDVVSGDFYWFSQRGSRKIIAAVDCTGHGVPGAFMSVLGNSLLNQIVNEHNIIEPDKILDELNRLTRVTLQQTGGNNLAHDGMDAALCVIDKETNMLSFAGAKRPLFFFRDQQLHVIKGDKFSIGGWPDEKTIPFTNHSLSLNSVQAFYLFSDGYYDQFQEESGRKFMISRFKNMIREVFPLPIAEQEALIEKRFREWKGGGEQVDDILVIGVKI
ncbi:MAG TPA: hypothetical protein DCE41_29245 [Cytophagales bacterium]|nr:hypothetical protein [Cytophagales bacterium]HAA18025.1 hypothetical protein [Cytophagales bacterium]HAP63067.1 hypothetical protein [Cytophagales bacterium]